MNPSLIEFITWEYLLALMGLLLFLGICLKLLSKQMASRSPWQVHQDQERAKKNKNYDSGVY